jgi:hypothetical protein
MAVCRRLVARLWHRPGLARETVLVLLVRTLLPGFHRKELKV